MLRLQGLDHVTITAHDPERSIRFYRDVLGLQAGPEWPGEITFLVCGQTALAVAWWSRGETVLERPKISIEHFAFRVDAETFERARTLLPTNGFPIDHVSDHGICRSLYLRDPDGHEVELACYELKGPPERMPQGKERSHVRP